MARGAWIATAGLVLALAACGCGDSPGPPEIGHASSGPITKQRVEEFARAVNLRAADLPSAESSPPGDVPESDPGVEAEAERCLEATAPPFPATVAAFDSPSFTYGSGGEFASFTSTVQAAPTEEEMAAVIDAFATPHGLACLEHAIGAELEESALGSGHYLSMDFQRIRRPLPLGATAVGLRIHAPFDSEGTDYDAYVDFILFIAGHAEITLAAVGMPEPVNQEVEAGLVSKLIHRAERHAL